jgi:hypothetical protein
MLLKTIGNQPAGERTLARCAGTNAAIDIGGVPLT